MIDEAKKAQEEYVQRQKEKRAKMSKEDRDQEDKEAKALDIKKKVLP